MDPHTDRNQNLLDPLTDSDNISPVCGLCPSGLLAVIHNRFHNSLVHLHLIIEIDLEFSLFQHYFRDKEIEIRDEILNCNTEFELATAERRLSTLTRQAQKQVEKLGTCPRFPILRQ